MSHPSQHSGPDIGRLMFGVFRAAEGNPAMDQMAGRPIDGEPRTTSPTWDPFHLDCALFAQRRPHTG